MIEHFDDVLVDRAVNEPTAPAVLSRAERRAAGRRLLARGMSIRVVADRLDVAERTAWRWSAELRDAA